MLNNKFYVQITDMLTRIYHIHQKGRHFSSSVVYKQIIYKQNLSDEINEENQHELLSKTVTPLAQIDYDEQLYQKRDWSKMILGQIKNKIKLNTTYNVRSITKFHDIIPSPQIDAYRNKDEFNIRSGVDLNPKTVGFFVGSPADGKTYCVTPDKLKNIKPTHIEIAQKFQDFIRNSDLNACHDLHDGGFWKGITVRSNFEGHHMIVIFVHPNGASDIEKEKAKRDITEQFSYSHIKSIYYQECPHTRCTNDSAPFELLHGEPHIYEKIGRYVFRISPDSFFQINTLTAPLLYESALGFLNLTQKTTLLDLCCGTGALSILASDYVRGCVGIESVEQSVEDAKFNAQFNDIKNCTFFPGRIEERLKRSLRHLEASPNVVAVLNPGRAGITKRGLMVLRDCVQLSQLVYISCKADNPNTFHNFVDLCSPKLAKNKCFTLTDVQPVDMFPHTNHCELVLHFRR